MFCTIEDIFVVVVQRVFPVGTAPLSTFSLRGSFSLINTPLKTTGIDGVNSRTQAGFPAPKKRPGPVQQEKNLLTLWHCHVFFWCYLLPLVKKGTTVRISGVFVFQTFLKSSSRRLRRKNMNSPRRCVKFVFPQIRDIPKWMVYNGKPY